VPKIVLYVNTFHKHSRNGTLFTQLHEYPLFCNDSTACLQKVREHVREHLITAMMTGKVAAVEAHALALYNGRFLSALDKICATGQRRDKKKR